MERTLDFLFFDDSLLNIGTSAPMLSKWTIEVASVQVSLNGMERLQHLETLHLKASENLSNINDIGDIQSLKYLKMNDVSSKCDLASLNDCKNLEVVKLRTFSGSLKISQDWLETCNKMTRLDLSGGNREISLDLLQCRNLTSLGIFGSRSIGTVFLKSGHP